MDRKLIARATDSSDAPTPGYMYVDIAKNASCSPAACNEIANYLTRKLGSKQNYNIKYKCCKVIAKLAEQVNRGQFKRAIIQDPQGVSAIKEAMNFRGPPDPVLGDEIYSRVRNAAREALDAVYADNPTSSEQQQHNAYGGGPPSYAGVGGGGGGPSHFSHPQAQSFDRSPYASGGGGGGRMEGIGNPMFADPRLHQEPEGFKAVLKDVGESFVGMIKDPLARNVDVPPYPQQQRGYPAGGAGGGYRPGGVPASGGMQGYGNSYNRPPPGSAELARATNGEWTMASNRGPNAVTQNAPPQNSAYYKSRDNSDPAFSWAHKNGAPVATTSAAPSANMGGVGGSWGSVATAPVPGGSAAAQARQPAYNGAHVPTPGSQPGNTGGGVSDGVYEKNLVMELCPPGGMKPVPPPDKLANFARSVGSLNPDLICPIVLDQLEEGQPWIIRAKALGVMETCIQSGGRADNTNPYADFFYECRDEIEPLVNHARQAIRDPARRVLTLLGVDAAASSANTPVQQQQQQPTAPVPAPVQPVANLLDFDDNAAPAPALAPVAPAAPAPAPAGGGASLFGGMQVKTAPARPAPTPAAAAPVTASANLLGDDPTTPTAAAPAPTATTTTMFDQLSIKDTVNGGEEKTNDLSGLATSGSAFGFINSSNEEKSAAATPKPTFDPLLTSPAGIVGGGGMADLTPNTAKKMMNMSPEQMQAMAFQQMMMQQQMQQMQMAFAMQGGAPGARPGAIPGAVPGVPGMPFGMPNGGKYVMGGHAPGGTSKGFSFLDNPTPQKKKDDPKFDFIKDAMKKG